MTVSYSVRTYSSCQNETILDEFAKFDIHIDFNPLSANITKWSNTLKQVVGKLPTNCLSVFDHFVGLALKELNLSLTSSPKSHFKASTPFLIIPPPLLKIFICTPFLLPPPAF